MKHEKTLPLQFPENFKVAVVINNLDIEYVLQEFIDSTSFYQFYSQKIDSFHNQINDGVLDLIHQYQQDYSTLKVANSHDVSFKYLKQIHDLKSDMQLSDAQKIACSSILMKEWENEQLPVLELPDILILEQNKSVKISFEFNMMCSLCRMKPEHALTQFMSQISIAKIQAYNQFDQESSYRNMPYLAIDNVPVTQLEIRKKYENKFTALHVKMSKVKSFAKRLVAYQDFYDQWYNELILE